MSDQLGIQKADSLMDQLTKFPLNPLKFVAQVLVLEGSNEIGKEFPHHCAPKRLISGHYKLIQTLF